MKNLPKYAKLLVAIGGLAVVIGHALVDGSVSPAEWGSIGTAAATAVGVWGVKNKTP